MKKVMMLDYIQARNRRHTLLAGIAVGSFISLMAVLGTLFLHTYCMIVYVETLEYTVTPFMVWMLKNIVWFTLGSLGCIFFLKPEVRERLDAFA